MFLFHFLIKFFTYKNCGCLYYTRKLYWFFPLIYSIFLNYSGLVVPFLLLIFVNLRVPFWILWNYWCLVFLPMLTNCKYLYKFRFHLPYSFLFMIHVQGSGGTSWLFFPICSCVIYLIIYACPCICQFSGANMWLQLILMKIRLIMHITMLLSMELMTALIS